MVEFLEILSQAAPDPDLDWLLPTAQVAEGFGVTPEAIRSIKSRRSDELLELRHWKKGESGKIWWSRMGVVRLGFFLEGDRAKAFRDAAEQFLVQSITPNVTPVDEAQPLLPSAMLLPPNNPLQVLQSAPPPLLESLLEQIGSDLALDLYRRLPEIILKHVQRIATAPTPEELAVVNTSFSQFYPQIRPALQAAIARLQEANQTQIPR